MVDRRRDGKITSHNAQESKRRKLKWFGHVTRGKGLVKTVLQGTVREERRRGKQKKRSEDSINEWRGLKMGDVVRCAEDRDRWRKGLAKTSLQMTVIGERRKL